MDLSQGRRRLIRRYFRGIGFPNPSGFLLVVYHMQRKKDEHSLNFSILQKRFLNIILLLNGKYDNPFSIIHPHFIRLF